MFVITADQVDSRITADLVTSTLKRLNSAAWNLMLPAERTVGDELQLLLSKADDALALTLELTRHGEWSVGLGIGETRTPLPTSIREASGTAFIAARTAIDRAKKSPTRFALEQATTTTDSTTQTADVEAFIDLVLALRARRSAEGWEVHDLLHDGGTQAHAAQRLGISPQAVSDRARSADLRVEFAARKPLARLLHHLDSVNTPSEGVSE